MRIYVLLYAYVPHAVLSLPFISAICDLIMPSSPASSEVIQARLHHHHARSLMVVCSYSNLISSELYTVHILLLVL